MRLFWTVLVVAAVIAGVISLMIGLHQSVWFDEAYSILLAKQPVGDILRLTGLDTHPPLYYLTLRAWAGVFGWGELALRSLSALGLAGSIVVGGLLLRKMFGAKLAIGGVLTLMVSPLLLRYGFEIRMYSMASFIGVSATYALYSAWKANGVAKTRWLIVYGALVALGMYTLYYMAFLWIAQVVWLAAMVICRKDNWRKLIPYVLSYAGALALFLPWLSTFLKQTTNGALAPIGQPLNLEQLLGVATFNTVYQPLNSLTMFFTVIIILFAMALWWIIPRAAKNLAGKRDEIILLVMYSGVPMILLMVISFFRAMYTERYLSHVAISFMMLLGVAVAALWQSRREQKKRIIAAAMIGAVLIIGVIQLVIAGNFNFQRMQTPTVKQAAATLQACAPGQKIVAADPYVMTELSYYVPDCQIYFVSDADTLRGGYAPYDKSHYQIKHINDITDRKVIYVYYGNPDQSLPARYHVQQRYEYGALNVAEYINEE